ncbi:MAG: hypothetical protein HN348_22545 [Proteobacteria bacterium]|nr:hypothetical protein [Pseudomonadota bacterium]
MNRPQSPSDRGFYQHHKYCAACKVYRKCYAGCRAACEQLNGGLHEVDPILWPPGQLDERAEAMLGPKRKATSVED